MAILPYKKKDLSIEYLMRMEINLNHSNEYESCCIMNDCNNKDDAAIKALKEKAGYTIYSEELIPLGWCWYSKSANTKIYLYTCDLTYIKHGFASMDSDVETLAYCEWININKVKETHDPITFMILEKMNQNRRK